MTSERPTEWAQQEMNIELEEPTDYGSALKGVGSEVGVEEFALFWVYLANTEEKMDVFRGRVPAVRTLCDSGSKTFFVF